jgi:phospholipase/lecithinase/hemolysin
VFGEFGGNDYNAMLFGNYNADQASTYTPQIVSTIANGVEKLIAMGATDIVVPGVLPIGCFPIYLTIYGTSNSGDYDSLGCLKKFNDLSTNHNNQLQTQISSLQAKYKSARIMYADFYSAVYDMVKNPGSYGTYIYIYTYSCHAWSLLAAAVVVVADLAIDRPADRRRTHMWSDRGRDYESQVVTKR